jgi:hypothetical protein
MKNKKSNIILITIISFLFINTQVYPVNYNQKNLFSNDSTTLKVIEGIIQLFKQKPD